MAIDWATFGHGEPWGRRLQIRDAGAIGGNALPKDDRSDVTRFRSAAAKRVQAHRARARLGFRCLRVRVGDREIRHLISRGYLSLESSKAKAAVAIVSSVLLFFYIFVLGRPPRGVPESEASAIPATSQEPTSAA